MPFTSFFMVGENGLNYHLSVRYRVWGRDRTRILCKVREGRVVIMVVVGLKGSGLSLSFPILYLFMIVQVLKLMGVMESGLASGVNRKHGKVRLR